MKLIRRITIKKYNELLNKRCDINPGIRYFDETHFEGLVKDPFEFKNDNGFMLRGGIYHYDNYDNKTIIVFCHGMFGGHQAYMKEINYIAKSGFQVLSIDYQGTILSEGDKLGGPTKALIDMDKLVKSIKNKYENIYMIGHSWGSFVAQGVAGLNNEIKKVVMLAPMISLHNLVKQHFDKWLKFIRKEILDYEYELYGEYSKSDAIVNLERNDLSALVIQSKNDNLLDFNLNLEALRNSIHNKKVDFCVVNDKKHNPTYTKEAVIKLNNYLKELKKTEFYDEKQLLAENASWDEMCELDTDIMDKIITFFKA